MTRMIEIEKPKRERESNERPPIFRTSQVVAIALAVGLTVGGAIYWQTHSAIGATIPQELQLKAPKDNILYSKNVTATTTEYAYSSNEVQGDFIWRGQFSNAQIVSQKGDKTTANIYGRDMFYQNNGKSYKIDIATTTTEAFSQQTKLSFLGWLLGEKAYAANVTATNDEYCVGNNVVFGTARNATNASNGCNVSFGWIGLSNTSNFIVQRFFASFVIPDMVSLTSASWFFYSQQGDYPVTDFDVYIHTSTYPAPTDASAFSSFNGWQTSGAYNGTVLNNTWNSSSYSTTTWNEIVFNATGTSTIFAARNTTFKMAAISKEDYINSAPTTNERITLYPSSNATYGDYLSITYTVASAPTVTTQSASSVTDTTATLNGNITVGGTASSTVRGFAWGTNSALSGGDTATTTDTAGQPFGTGAFTAAITGLTKGTNYYARAYATNSVGTGFGSIQALTSNLQSDVIIFRNNVILNNNVILK